MSLTLVSREREEVPAWSWSPARVLGCDPGKLSPAGAWQPQQPPVHPGALKSGLRMAQALGPGGCDA